MAKFSEEEFKKLKKAAYVCVRGTGDSEEVTINSQKWDFLNSQLKRVLGNPKYAITDGGLLGFGCRVGNIFTWCKLTAGEYDCGGSSSGIYIATKENRRFEELPPFCSGFKKVETKYGEYRE